MDEVSWAYQASWDHSDLTRSHSVSLLRLAKDFFESLQWRHPRRFCETNHLAHHLRTYSPTPSSICSAWRDDRQPWGVKGKTGARLYTWMLSGSSSSGTLNRWQKENSRRLWKTEAGTWARRITPSEVSLILDCDAPRKYSLHSESLSRSTWQNRIPQRLYWNAPTFFLDQNPYMQKLAPFCWVEKLSYGKKGVGSVPMCVILSILLT